MVYFLLLMSCLIPAFGFSSNVTKLNDYLNSEDPILKKFHAGLPAEEGLAKVLPARLGFATFGSQNAFLAASQAVTDHLDQKRFAPQDRKSAKPSKHAANSVDTDELLVDASEKKMGRRKSCEPQPCHSEGHFTGWLSPFGEYAHEKPQPDVAAFSFDVGGAVAGLDYNTVNDDVIGFGGSYVFTHVWEDADAGDANINQGFLGAYTLLHASDWYFNMGLWGGYYHTNNKRNMTVATTTSTTHGWQLAPHAEIGYEGYLARVCAEQWFGVGPFILADWVANWEHGFKEHGGGLFNMQIDGRFCSLLRGEAGLRIHETVRCCWGDVVFQQKGSYAYQKMFGTGTITSAVVGVPSSFTVNTLIYAQNLGVFEFSVLFKPINHKWPYGTIRYQGEFGSRYQSHQGIVEIGKDF